MALNNNTDQTSLHSGSAAPLEGKTTRGIVDLLKEAYVAVSRMLPGLGPKSGGPSPAARLAARPAAAAKGPGMKGPGSMFAPRDPSSGPRPPRDAE